MIHIIEGDLLVDSNCNVIGHQANCMSTMNSGIAKQIRMMYPGVYEVDKKFPFPASDRLGKTSYWTDGALYIFNLYGQFAYGKGKKHTNYEALENAMELMLKKIIEMENENPNFKAKIGFPYKIGSDLGGGDWNVVYKKIENVFVKKGNREVFLYKLNK